jgi:hypothetical protein
MRSAFLTALTVQELEATVDVAIRLQLSELVLCLNMTAAHLPALTRMLPSAAPPPKKQTAACYIGQDAVPGGPGRA